MADKKMSVTSEELRKTLNTLDTGASTTPDALFAMIDRDGSGALDKAEFAKVYEQMKKHVAEEHVREIAEHKQLETAKRRNKVMGLVSVLLAVFLAISIAGNAAATFAVSEMTKELTTSSTEGTSMLSDTAGAPLATAQEPRSTMDLPFPRLSHARLRAIEGLNLTFPIALQPHSTNEIYVHVLGYTKTVCGPSAPSTCTPSVTFSTPEADVMYFYAADGTTVQHSVTSHSNTGAIHAAIVAAGGGPDTTAMRRHLAELPESHALVAAHNYAVAHGRTMFLPCLMCMYCCVTIAVGIIRLGCATIDELGCGYGGR